MKFLIPLKLNNYDAHPSPLAEGGFAFCYIKDGWLYKQLPDGSGNLDLTDLVLDRPLDDLNLPTTAIELDSSDTVLTAFSKLQATLLNIVLVDGTTGDPAFYDNGALKIPLDFNSLGGSSFTVKANNGLDLSSSDPKELSTIYNTTIADTVLSTPVGGAASQAASVWKTRNLVQVLDAILFPDQSPTYTIPTIGLSSTITGTREIGETISPAFTVTAVKNDAGPFYAMRLKRGATTVASTAAPTASSATDVPDQYGYANQNNPNKTYTFGATDSSFAVPSGTTTWTSEGDYAGGFAKKNNKGVTDPRTPLVRNVNAPQLTSTAFTSNGLTITGIYPYFWGVSDTVLTASQVATLIAAGGAGINKVLTAASGTITIDFDASSPKYLWFAHAGSYTTKTKWYITALNNGNISSGSDLFSAPTSQNVNSPDSYWSAVSFKIYISNFPTTAPDPMELRNS